MEYKNNEQNSVIFLIAEILGKMSNQVGFLIRNNKLMSQLDVDMLMENTRKLYDTICSVRCNMDVDSIPMEVENEEELGIKGEESRIMNEEAEVEERIEDEEVDEESDEEVEVEDDEMFSFEFDEDSDEEDAEVEFEEDIEETDTDEDVDAYEDEMDDEHEDENEEDTESDSGIRAYRITREEPITTNQPQTIGDILENAEDNSLAARLQKKPIADLTTAIGINDKFLLLNELFSGSMEKYNKSIRALNNFPTLLGAKTYMSELQIEFQWDCDSEAYKKLTDLIERRFISIHNA